MNKFMSKMIGFSFVYFSIPFSKSQTSAGANNRCPRRRKPKHVVIGLHITAQTANI